MAPVPTRRAGPGRDHPCRPADGRRILPPAPHRVLARIMHPVGWMQHEIRRKAIASHDLGALVTAVPATQTTLQCMTTRSGVTAWPVPDFVRSRQRGGRLLSGTCVQSLGEHDL